MRKSKLKVDNYTAGDYDYAYNNYNINNNVAEQKHLCRFRGNTEFGLKCSTLDTGH